MLNAASAAVAAQVVDAPIPIPAPSTGVRLQYQGMQQVLASAQQQQLPYQHHPQQPHHHHTSSGGGGLQGPGGSDGGAAGGSDGGAAVAMGPPPMRQTTATLGREADAYFGRVVEAAWDLREAMLQVGHLGGNTARARAHGVLTGGRERVRCVRACVCVERHADVAWAHAGP